MIVKLQIDFKVDESFLVALIELGAALEKLPCSDIEKDEINFLLNENLKRLPRYYSRSQTAVSVHTASFLTRLCNLAKGDDQDQAQQLIDYIKHRD